MHFNPLLTTPLLTLTSALPTTPRSNPIRLTPSTSTGFALRANLLDPTRDLVPTIQNLYLSDQRTGAGTSLTVLGTTPTPFYLNGTAYAAPTTITHDIPGVYPLSINIASPSTFDAPLYPTEHPITTTANGAATPLSLRRYPSPPILLPQAGDEGGVYAVCLRDVVFGGEEAAVLTARYVYGGESVPADCAPVEFVVECAVLPDLPAGSSWNHDSALEVACVA